MAHAHPTYDTNKIFVIDAPTKNILVPEPNKPVVVQYDHYSEVITFEIDRYVEGHDLSLSDKVEVHYNNIDKDGRRTSRGLYLAEDLRVHYTDKKKVVVSWYISDQATKYEGTLNFVVSFICLDSEVDISYRWNSHVGTILVSAGINNTEYLEQNYADVLEMWKQDLFGIADSEEATMLGISAQQQAIMNETAAKCTEAMETKASQLIATIPEEYDALQTTVDTLIEEHYIPSTTIDGNAITETYRDGHYRVTTIEGDIITEKWYTADNTLTQTKTIAISQKSVAETITTV